MEKRWVGCLEQNFRQGRSGGLSPEIIVLHSLGGALGLASQRFNAPSFTSAHYAIGKDGSVLQFVRETDTAFHAGVVVNPSNPIVQQRPGVNPNFYSIGIEHEGDAVTAPSAEQRRATAELIAEVATRWKIPLDADHVVTHRAIRASANCPGSVWPIDEIIQDAGRAAGRGRIPSQSVVRTVVRANIRSAPSRSAPIQRVVSAESMFAAGSFVEGEGVSGNSSWYANEGATEFLWAGATDHPNPVEAKLDEEGPHTTDLMERIDVPPPAPALPTSLSINRTLALPSKEYYVQETRKDLVVLHFTAGSTARGAIDSWRKDPQHVATAYVVDLDGTIYEAFDPRYWAYHLGIKGSSVHEKRSIGIEIVNVGPLKEVGGNLNWWYKDFGTVFCPLTDTSRYKEKAFRNIRYFADFPQAQVVAVASLVRHLCDQFEIPLELTPEAKRYSFDPTFYANYRGITSHANFRQDKWDIGPAYPWETLP